jgi:nitrogen-specific signal transduction histidine kinase
MWNSSVPVLLFESESLRIVMVNDTAVALFKSSSKDLLGQSVDGCVVAEERTRLAASIGKYEARWGDVGPWQCLARDGSRFVAHIRFHQTMHQGKLVHVVLATEVAYLETTRSAAAGFGDSPPVSS